MTKRLFGSKSPSKDRLSLQSSVNQSRFSALGQLERSALWGGEDAVKTRFVGQSSIFQKTAQSSQEK